MIAPPARLCPQPSATAEPVKFHSRLPLQHGTTSARIRSRGAATAGPTGIRDGTFCRLPGTIHDWVSNGEGVADDSYHRYPEDIALMASAGLKAYRFSISWPRVLPDGTGQPDAKGLDYYSRLVDAGGAEGRWIEP